MRNGINYTMQDDIINVLCTQVHPPKQHEEIYTISLNTMVQRVHSNVQCHDIPYLFRVY